MLPLLELAGERERGSEGARRERETETERERDGGREAGVGGEGGGIDR